MRYRFTGETDEIAAFLSGELVHEQGREDAVLHPGDEIEVEAVICHPHFEPLDDATKTAIEEMLATEVHDASSLPAEEDDESDGGGVAPDLEARGGSEHFPGGPTTPSDQDAPVTGQDEKE